jgi:hypothetical protein
VSRGWPTTNSTSHSPGRTAQPRRRALPRRFPLPCPSFKRVKVLHFTDIELPRTGTRKVKRREVVQIMGRSRRVRIGERVKCRKCEDADSMWLIGVVASVAIVALGSLDRYPD